MVVEHHKIACIHEHNQSYPSSDQSFYVAKHNSHGLGAQCSSNFFFRILSILTHTHKKRGKFFKEIDNNV